MDMDHFEEPAPEKADAPWTWAEIEERYLKLVQYVVDLSKRVEKLSRELYHTRQKGLGLKGLVDSMREFVSLAITKDNRVMTVLSPRPRPEIQQWFTSSATPAQKAKPEYQLLVTSFRDEQLASHLRDHFGIGAEEVRALQAIHDAKKQVIVQWSPARVLGIVLAAFAVLVKFLPKEFFEHVGWDYAKVVFWETIVGLFLLIYVGIVFLPTWVRLYRDSRAYRQFGRILLYLSLITSAPPQPGGSPPFGS